MTGRKKMTRMAGKDGEERRRSREREKDFLRLDISTRAREGDKGGREREKYLAALNGQREAERHRAGGLGARERVGVRAGLLVQTATGGEVRDMYGVRGAKK